MALLTGRNQHQCSMATVVDTSTGFPGDTGVRPTAVRRSARSLHRWGYVTVLLRQVSRGAPPYEVSVSGPFDRWPAHSGFDKFYGYLAGEQSSLNPNLIDGVTHIGTPSDPEYHFNIDMTDQAIAWVQATRSLTPDRPFLMYYSSQRRAPAAHPAEGLVGEGPVQGRVRRGLGCDARADPRAPERDGHRPARHQAGRQPRLHPALGQPLRGREDRLRPADGGLRHPGRERRPRGRPPGRRDRRARRTRQHAVHLHRRRQRRLLDRRHQRCVRRVGPAERRARRHPLPAQPARRVRRPELLPQLLRRLGAGRVDPGDVVHPDGPRAAATWPALSCTGPRASRPRARSAASTTSVIDVVPTILEAVGVPEPEDRQRRRADPDRRGQHGYTFDDAQRHRRHTTQYNEASGNRSIYHDGWLAAVVHRAPWEPAPARRRLRRGPVGAVQHGRGLRPGQRPRRPVPREARGDEGSSSPPKRSRTTCSRSTTAPSNDSTRSSPAGPT